MDVQHRATEICKAAAHLPADEQSDYVSVKCAGDPELLEVVEKLLRERDTAKTEVVATDDRWNTPSVENSDDPARLAKNRIPQAGETEVISNAPFGGELPMHPNDHRDGTANLYGNETVVPLDEAAANLGKPGTSHSIGDYEILEELGRGGMGVVYKARQKSLDRIVALKMILPGHFSSPRAIERFRAEAQATAQLDHPGIVPVFDVRDEEGTFYYSMGYVEGESLADHLEASDGPLAPKIAARLVRDIAQAIQVTHEAGILHRDLKPANILLDSNQQPRITDFGLAKKIKVDTKITLAGQVVGTPSYMSPEQASPTKGVGPQTDVYSVGAILYELLTCRPPFHAASVMATLQQVLHDEPAPIRLLNSSVPKDLETICLKCLQKQPDKRYATARVLADELQRFLDGLPIRARPVTRAERVIRWCRRHPIESALTGGLILAVLSALIVFGVSNRALQRKNIELGKALSETRRARAAENESFRQALGAVNDLFTRVSEDRLLKEPGMQPLRRDLLARARDYYKILLQQRGRDVRLRDELTMAYFRVGFIVEQLDSPQAAVASYRKAENMLRESIDEAGPTDARLEILGDTMNALGRVFHRMQQVRNAEDAYAEAILIRRRLSKSNPSSDESVRKLANSLMNFGIVKQQSDRKLAVKNMRRAQELRESLTEQNDWNTQVQRDAAIGDFNLMKVALEANELIEANTYLEKSLQRLRDLHSEDPDDMDYRNRLSLCLRLRGDLALQLSGDVDRATRSYQEALKIAAKLAGENPEVDGYQAAHAEALLSLGKLEARRNSLKASLEWFRKAKPILVSLLDGQPEVRRHRENLVLTSQAIAESSFALGDKTSAVAELKKLVTLLSDLESRLPNAEDVTQHLAKTRQVLDSLGVHPNASSSGN